MNVVKDIYDQLQELCGGAATPVMFGLALRGRVEKGLVFQPEDLDAVYLAGSDESKLVLRTVLPTKGSGEFVKGMSRLVENLSEAVTLFETDCFTTDYVHGEDPFNHALTLLNAFNDMKVNKHLLNLTRSITTVAEAVEYAEKIEALATTEFEFVKNISKAYSDFYHQWSNETVVGEPSVLDLPPELSLETLLRVKLTIERVEHLRAIAGRLRDIVRDERKVS